LLVQLVVDQGGDVQRIADQVQNTDGAVQRGVQHLQTVGLQLLNINSYSDPPFVAQSLMHQRKLQKHMLIFSCVALVAGGIAAILLVVVFNK
jgi:hypothetical protein